MPKTLALTSFNGELYRAYAHRFIETYAGDVDLMVVSEESLPTMGRIQTVQMRAHTTFVKVNGWRRPQSFKQDAVRFCYKVYAIWTAFHEVRPHWGEGPYDSILWIDADTVFRKPLTQHWIDTHLATEGVMSYLGRSNSHSECGLLWFNLMNTTTEKYIRRVVELYNTNDIYKLKEQHDSFVWDHVRQEFQRSRDKNLDGHFRNLAEHVTERVPGGHIQAVLFGEWFDHTKGKRKQQGYSRENAHSSR